MRSIRRYFSPENEILFIAGLHVSYTVANYQLLVLTTMLTNGWNMALFNAVCITTIQNGVKKLLSILSAYLADKYTGHTKMMLLSALCYCAGLFAWHFLVGYPDQELTVKPKVPLAWIFLSLVLMTLGQCSYYYYEARKPVDSNKQGGVKEGGSQAFDNTSKQERERKFLLRQNGFKKTRLPRLFFCKRTTKRLVRKILYDLAISRFKIFGIAIATWWIYSCFPIAIAMGISLIVLCIGKLCFYPFEKPKGSPLSLVFRVLKVAFMRRRFCDTPQGTCQYYNGGDNHAHPDHVQSELHISANADDNVGVENEGHPQETEQPLLKAGVINPENADLENPYYDDCDGTFDDCQNQANDNKLNQATDEIIEDVDNEDCHDNKIASGDNLHYGTGGSAGDLKDGEQNFEPQNGLTDQLWILNKAAIYDSSFENPKIEADNERLCAVNQVKETKKFLSKTQLSLIFVMYGVMESVSETFFVEQADDMNALTYYDMDIPVQVILYSSGLTEYLLILANWNWGRKHNQAKRTRFSGSTKIGVGMGLSVILFMIAFWIEKMRLKALRDDQIISIFWLIPQCSLLGAIRGFIAPEEFFNEEMPKSFSRSSYSSVLANGVIGIGRLLSLLVLLIVSSCSKRGTESGWIGHDIDSSRIDYYYAVMAGFGVVCCIIYGWVTYTYCRHKAKG